MNLVSLNILYISLKSCSNYFLFKNNDTNNKQHHYEIIAGSYVVSLCSEDSSNWQFFHHNPLIAPKTDKTTSLWNHCWFICCFTCFLKIPEIDHSPILIVCDFLITFNFQITSNIEKTTLFWNNCWFICCYFLITFF